MPRLRRTGLASLAALLLAGMSAGAQSTFPTEPVGTASGTQSVTVTSPAGGNVTGVEVLTAGSGGMDFAKVLGGSTCESDVLAATGTCTENVTFTPSAPGLREGAVVLIGTVSGGATAVIGTAYISGTGIAGLGVVTSGNLLPVAGQQGLYTQVDDGQPATKAQLNLPASVVLDGNGNMYIADSLHNRIRMVCGTSTTATIHGTSCSTAGIISTISGNGNPSYTGDGGAAASATLNTPSGLALDGAGDLYIADTGNNVIREISAATGVITTVAGNGTGCAGQSDSVGDGCPAYASNGQSAVLNQPWGVTLDASGNLFIADTADHRIREVKVETGVISTVAGDGFTNPDGTGGFAGDGGQAMSAELNRPFAVVFDANGNMYIPDSANNRVRMVCAGAASAPAYVTACTAAGIITTIAGNGSAGDAGYSTTTPPPATQVGLWSPSGVAVDPAGDLFIADTQNDAIREVSATNGTISTVVANGVGEYFYNGALASTVLYGPIGLFLDESGNLYLADYYDMVVREIQSNFVALDYTKTAVRQGSKSATKNQPIENEGNATLDLTSITPDANASLDDSATTCNTGTPYLAVAADCTIGAVFAPSTAGDPLSGNIDVAGATINSPLDIQLIGNATAVNSTTVTVASSLDPSDFGQSVTLTATVTTGSGTGILTGTVNFYDTYNGTTTTLDSNVKISVDSAGTTAIATFSTAALGVGQHTITASYSGDSGHFSSTSTDNGAQPLTQTVQEATATALTSSQNPSAVGQNVTFTATVTISGGGGVQPDGTVTFTDGATTLTTVTLNASGMATLSTAALTAGIHSITATYNGDPNNEILGSPQATLSQDVQAPSSISVASSLNPSNYGNSVTFTATVTPGAPYLPPQGKTETVNFLDGTTQIGSATLSTTTNEATFTTSTLVVGQHSITAVYVADESNGASTSPAITQTVNQTQTSTTVTAAPNTAANTIVAGAPVAITATVKVIAGSAATTGTVTFTDNGAPLGAATLGADGTATIDPTLAAGGHAIVATYGGDANDEGSTGSLTITVALATTAISVQSSQNPAIVESPVTFTATVTGNGGIPDGTVTFFADGTSIGTATLAVTGKVDTAAITDSTLPAGNHAITANYNGDANDSPSTSAAINQLIGTIPTVAGLGTSTTGGTNPQVILVATITNTAGAGPVPTGTVTFNNGTSVVGQATLDASGVATLTPSLPSGTYSIVASYGGDALHSPSTSQPVTISTVPTGFNLTVNPATVSLSSSQNASVTVTLTSASGFADTIGLGCSSLPAAVTCTFASPSVTLSSNGSQTAQLTIDTNYPLTGGSAARNTPPGSRGAELAGLFLPFGAVFGWIFWRLRKRKGVLLSMVLVSMLSGAALLASGCGGISMGSAAPGTYVIQVTGTGTKSNIIHYANVTLNIAK